MAYFHINKIVKMQYTGVGPIHCIPFIFIALLDKKPEKELYFVEQFVMFQKPVFSLTEYTFI